MPVDNMSLLKLKNELTALPVLEKRLQKVYDRIHKARAEVEELLQKYEKEALDVERIRKESFSATLLKLVGLYKGKVEKEMEEMLHAKTRYDAASVQLTELECEASRLKSRIEELRRDKRAYEEEMERREALLKNSISSEASKVYTKLCEEADYLSRQLTETEEALRAANRAYETCRSALEYLDEAEGWAAYDVWISKGLISHMIKYDKIDMAQEAFARLNAQLNELRLELDDIDLDIDFPQISFDSATRFLDIWFDNIFTDLRVRNQIRDYQDYARELCDKITRIREKLSSTRKDLTEAVRKIEERQEEIVISFEPGE